MLDKSSSNLMLFILGSSFITLGAIAASANKDKLMPNSTVKVAGIVDRIGSNKRTVFLLKDNKTSFYPYRA